MQNYIEQTVRGFIQSSAKSLRRPEADCASLLVEQVAHIPAGIQSALRQEPAGPAIVLAGA